MKWMDNGGLFILANPWDQDYLNNKLLLKLIDGCYDDANVGFDVSIDLLTHYSSGDIDLIHNGVDVVHGVLNEFSHPNPISVEESKDVGGFFEGAI